MDLPFHDRTHAGAVLAGNLSQLDLSSPAGREPIVLGLPRGGVPVAFEIADRLDAPLDIFVVRKLGVPGHEELAMGAIASGGVRVLNDEVMRYVDVSPDALEAATEAQRVELRRRETAYRGARPPPELADRVVVLVDDGLATGSTMKAAVGAVREHRPDRIVVAVPVGASESCAEIESLVDDIVCGATPQPFRAVGMWYRNFDQTTDDEVRELLARARDRSRAGS